MESVEERQREEKRKRPNERYLTALKANFACSNPPIV